MVHMHNFVCHLVKSEMSMFVAEQLSVKSETLNNRISLTERQGAHVGRVAAQPFVVSS
jgi:hypothetical protein